MSSNRVVGFLWCAALLMVALAPAMPLAAQAPDDTAATLLTRVYGLIRDEALTPPDGLSVLRAAAVGTQQALQAAGAAELAPPPALTGRESDDLHAVAAYLQAAVRAMAPRPPEPVIAGALRGMVRAAGDPMGAAFTPPEFIQYSQELRGEHEGIGAQVDLLNGEIVITDVSDGGPARRAGVEAGDVLLEVGGLPVLGRTPDQVLELLRGRGGTTVTLTLRRRSGVLARVTLPRERARENPTRSRMLDSRIGYLRLLEFSDDAHRDLERALLALRARGASALVFDLRDNGGGLVDEAVAVGSIFLPDGIVAMEEMRGKMVPLDVRRGGTRFPGPVTVLVNAFTASASEIVSGALQDVGAVLVGTKTFGKATVQTIFSLPFGWGLRLTTARYFTRRGRMIDGVGLTPTIIVPMAEDQIQGPRDTQLQEGYAQARSRLESTTRP